jgi:Xaa-Pro aminopeptidase
MDKPTLGALEQALFDHNIDHSIDEVRDIINGVAASPEPNGAMGAPDVWHRLIGSSVQPELAGLLSSELALARKTDDGLTKSGTGPWPSANRLADLRKEMKAQSIDGFIIPLADEHQGEYVPKNAQRLTWLTGFTGSAGLAVVLASKAAIFVDGRYTLQAGEQVDSDHFEINHLVDTPADNWIADNLNAGEELGFDPWLHTADGVGRLRRVCEKAGGKLTPVSTNPVDAVWASQPPPSLTPAHLLDSSFTGSKSADKRQEISEILKSENVDAFVLTAPDSIAWLSNMRGGDVPYTPFSLAFGIIHADSSLDIYSDLRKFTDSVIETLGDDVTLHPRAEFLSALQHLGSKKLKVGIDLMSAAEIISQKIKESGGIIQRLTDPCQLPKARKNEVELNGMRQAHLRDGVALTRFLAWLDKNAPKGELSEMSAAEQLEKFRREGEHIQGLSFPTISGSGPNGAIVHYRVTQQSNRKLDQNSLYLVDSGAQYLDGTTDVTRTIAIGTPSAEMKDRFTRVLKGHIALARAVFPEGTSGSQLDILARSSLWQAGIDYDHGTGHGVGSFLGVHEGPHRISKMPSRVALEPGMVVSNEPGYYKSGEFGIRIENLVAVVEASAPDNAERPLYCFETLTLAPIDLTLIDNNLLNQGELDWIDGYHEKVRKALSPMLDEETKKWLIETTKYGNSDKPKFPN